MSEVLETVTIARKDHPNGKVDINKSDFAEGVDVLFVDSSCQTPNKYTVEWYARELKALNIPFDEDLKKADLKAIYDYAVDNKN